MTDPAKFRREFMRWVLLLALNNARDADGASDTLLLSIILADLRAIEVVKGVARIPDRRTTGDDGGKRHGDAAVAGCLAYAASRRDVAPIEFTALGHVRMNSRMADYMGL